MKNLLNGAWRCNGSAFTTLFIVFLLATGFTACKKESAATPEEEMEMAEARNSRSDAVKCYTGLPRKTQWELQQARAATARYRNFDNAIRDGYADIDVVVPEMGYHFLKAAILDDKFDYRHPEILVYNKNHKGRLELVAVEYAVPLDLSENAPDGFTGDKDVWDRNTGFGLWLLHAWVWAYNPDGVFNPTNPAVHVH